MTGAATLAHPARRFRVGAYAIEVGQAPADVLRSIDHLYGRYPRVAPGEFVDFSVGVRRRRLPRPWVPQSVFVVEGEEPFNPLPGNQGFPLLEWGLNWCIYGLCHQHLTIHAAVLERGGRAIVIPAPSGSGKSTLCAGLLFRGWRLLSDEFALVCPRSGELIPNPRPVSLKNESIEVVRRFAPEAEFGSLVRDTVKGVVGHFRVPDEALQRARERAAPGWIVVPRFTPGNPPTLRRMDRALAFMRLVENAFNYAVFGRQGFEMLGALVDRSQCFTFEYGDLGAATELFDRLSRGDPGVCG